MSTTAVDLAIRRAARVQEAVTQKGWSLNTAAALADELGVDVRTVRRIWGRVQRWTRAALNPSDVEAMRVRQLMRLEANIAAAAAAGQYGAAFKGEQVYGQLTGTITAAKVEVSGGYSVTHSAAIARVSQMSLPELLAEIDELDGMQRRVIEGRAAAAAEG